MNEGPPIVEQLVGEQPDDNLFGVLAAKRQTIADAREKDVPVPGYDREPPLLYIRYRLLEGPELNRIGNKVKGETANAWERQLRASVDIMIAACVGFYVDLGDGEKKPLTFHGEHITSFGPELAEALQYNGDLPDDTARAVVYGLLGNKELMLVSHSTMLQAWFNDATTEVSKDMFMQGNL